MVKKFLQESGFDQLKSMVAALWSAQRQKNLQTLARYSKALLEIRCLTDFGVLLLSPELGVWLRWWGQFENRRTQLLLQCLLHSLALASYWALEI